MAKDDYFVIMYQVLKYLYDQHKQGQRADEHKLTAHYYQVNPLYWAYILENLKKQGFVVGYQSVKTKDGILFSSLSDTMITPKGIEYLFENSMLEKVKQTLKDIKDIVPLI